MKTILNYITEKLRISKDKKDLPIIGAIYEDTITGDEVEVMTYCSKDGSECDANHRNNLEETAEDLISNWDQTGAWDDENIKDYPDDSIFVGCWYEKFGEHCVLLWNDRINTNSLIKEN